METTQSTNLTGWRKEGEREGEEGGKGKNGPSSHIAHLSFRCCRYFLGFSLFCSSRPFSPSPRPFSFSPLLLASSQPSTSPQPPLVGLPFPSHSPFPFPSPLPSLLPITSHHITSHPPDPLKCKMHMHAGTERRVPSPWDDSGGPSNHNNYSNSSNNNNGWHSPTSPVRYIKVEYGGTCFQIVQKARPGRLIKNNITILSYLRDTSTVPILSCIKTPTFQFYRSTDQRSLRCVYSCFFPEILEIGAWDLECCRQRTGMMGCVCVLVACSA